MNLFKASNQWAERPDDERFWSVEDLDRACRTYREAAREAHVPYATLRAEVDGTEVILAGQKNKAQLTHWAFAQLSTRAGAPASYLRTLPATLAVTCLNHGLAERQDDEKAVLLLHPNGRLLCRAMLTEQYVRIWNSDITSRLARLVNERGWRVPPARPAPGYKGETRLATAADVSRLGGASGLSIKVGDTIAPAGLYASDHDLFAFLVNEGSIVDGGGGEFLGRGAMIWNSEVGASSFGVMTFLYDYVCGNHIIWGATKIKELRVRHVGDAENRFKELTGKLVEYAETSAKEDELKIAAAKTFVLGKDKDAVLDRVFGLRIPVLSRKMIGEAYDVAVEHEASHGAPNTAWGMASGLTRLSQTVTSYADERVTLDRAAGKVLEVAF